MTKRLFSFFVCLLLIFSFALGKADEIIYLFKNIPFGASEEEVRAAWNKAKESENLPDLLPMQDNEIIASAPVEFGGTQFDTFQTSFSEKGSFVIILKNVFAFPSDEEGALENLLSEISAHYSWMNAEFGRPSMIFSTLIDSEKNGKGQLRAQPFYSEDTMDIPKFLDIFNKYNGRLVFRSEWHNVSFRVILEHNDNGGGVFFDVAFRNYDFSDLYEPTAYSIPVACTFPEIDFLSLPESIAYAKDIPVLPEQLIAGEWIVDIHIPAGEYSADILKSGTFTLTDWTGKLRQSETVSAEERIGRIVLEPGDILHISNAEIIFALSKQ